MKTLNYFVIQVLLNKFLQIFVCFYVIWVLAALHAGQLLSCPTIFLTFFFLEFFDQFSGSDGVFVLTSWQKYCSGARQKCLFWDPKSQYMNFKNYLQFVRSPASQIIQWRGFARLWTLLFPNFVYSFFGQNCKLEYWVLFPYDVFWGSKIFLSSTLAALTSNKDWIFLFLA